MRIALLSPLQETVPPDGYGGVESVVAALADGFVAAGHQVTLFARAGSSTQADVVAVVAELPPQPGRQLEVELEHALECMLRADDFDVVNSHLGVLGAAIGPNGKAPIIHTVSDPMDRTAEVWAKLARHVPGLRLLSLSSRQQELAPHLPWIASIPNPVDVERFPFRPGAEDYLAFLGRMSADKGVDVAIRVAERTGRRLRIGAKLREGHERKYFEEHVQPHLGGGAEYLGELDDAGKVELLARAAATLFPAEIEEAFGLVSAESMACGTPVIAFRRGAIPEIVDHGRTGFVVDDEEQMQRAVGRIAEIDRAACRRHVEQHFAVDRVVARYEGVFRQLG